MVFDAFEYFVHLVSTQDEVLAGFQDLSTVVLHDTLNVVVLLQCLFEIVVPHVFELGPELHVFFFELVDVLYLRTQPLLVVGLYSFEEDQIISDFVDHGFELLVLRLNSSNFVFNSISNVLNSL